VSVGSSLARAAYGAFLRGAREIRDDGTFTFAQQAIPFAEINAMFRQESRR
jgi:2-methylisocitrate lyase-like PEP mutase family enzyme